MKGCLFIAVRCIDLGKPGDQKSSQLLVSVVGSIMQCWPATPCEADKSIHIIESNRISIHPYPPTHTHRETEKWRY